MRKKFAYVVAIAVCLALAQVGLTLWQSFDAAAGGEMRYAP